MTTARPTAARPRVLGVFAKQPQPGRVKTRLAAQVSAGWAAQVAEAFLLDTLHRLQQIEARRLLAFAPAEAGPYFADLAADRFALVPQAAGDLGVRMEAFFRETLAATAGRVVLVGTDSPNLPPSYLEQAFDELQHADVVLGPAADGGYYLLGCAGRLPPVFEGIAWGTSAVLRQTIDRLADPSWRLALLPPWYDIDTLDDWRMLQGHVAAQRRAGMDPGLPHTERLLRDALP
jgi:rSAM/selenodomain-associated transferase 1